MCINRLAEIVLFFFLGDRKKKGWTKRRRRQSDSKSSLKTLPKEDDSDDACEKSGCALIFISQAPSAITSSPACFVFVSRFDFNFREQ